MPQTTKQDRRTTIQFLLKRYEHLADTCLPNDPQYPDMDKIEQEIQDNGYQLKFATNEGGWYCESI